MDDDRDRDTREPGGEERGMDDREHRRLPR
jgi:hypothetical protein